MFKLKEKINKLTELLKSKNRLFEDDLPNEDLKILSQCMVKYAPEYAVKHEIMESNIEILENQSKHQLEKNKDLIKLLKSSDLSKVEFTDEIGDLVLENIFDKHIEARGYFYEGFFENLDEGFTPDGYDCFPDLKCFPTIYVKPGATKYNPSISEVNHATFITSMLAYPFANGYIVYKVEEYL